MPIGDYYSLTYKNKIGKFIYSFLGVLDLHTHIRLFPVIKFFENFLNTSRSVTILELGCGNGINAFEIYKLSARKKVDLKYIGVDLSLPSITAANYILQSCQKIDSRTANKISFIHNDAVTFLEKQQCLSVDVVLLVDVIEHIKNPDKLINLCAKHLNKKGIFVVSVPTPLYQKIFGKEFHNKIGHVIDGYTLESLNKLFNNLRFKCKKYKYNTGFISNIGCWLYYNKLIFNNKYLNFLKELLLYPFKYFDFYNSPKVSCSLFAVYEREES